MKNDFTTVRSRPRARSTAACTQPCAPALSALFISMNLSCTTWRCAERSLTICSTASRWEASSPRLHAMAAEAAAGCSPSPLSLHPAGSPPATAASKQTDCCPLAPHSRALIPRRSRSASARCDAAAGICGVKTTALLARLVYSWGVGSANCASVWSRSNVGTCMTHCSSAEEP